MAASGQQEPARFGRAGGVLRIRHVHARQDCLCSLDRVDGIGFATHASYRSGWPQNFFVLRVRAWRSSGHEAQTQSHFHPATGALLLHPPAQQLITDTDPEPHADPAWSSDRGGGSASARGDVEGVW